VEEKTRAMLRAGTKVGAFPQRYVGNIKNSEIPKRTFLIKHLTGKRFLNDPPISTALLRFGFILK